MGFLDSFLILGVFLVGLPVAWGVGWVLEKITGSAFLGRLPILLAFGALLFGIPLSLRLAGVQTVGRIVNHSERVDLARLDRSWTISQWLGVRFLPANPRRADPTTRDATSDSVTLQLRSTATMYDSLPVGAKVAVTYLSFRPSIAKLSERTMGDLLREFMEIEGALPLIAIFGSIVLAVMLSRWRPTWGAARGLRTMGFIVLGVIGAVGAERTIFGSTVHGSDDPMPATARAEVVGVSSVEDGRCFLCGRNETQRLNQPYQVVTLAFTPSGAKWPVKTADAIDSGSVRGLRTGATLEVRYAPTTPRHARIEGARRTFETRNGRDAFWQSALVVGGGLGVLLLFSLITRRWRKAGAASNP